jgi:hypothetical protein
MKKVIIIVGILVVIIIGVIVAVFTSLDRIVAAAIEKYGSMATQTNVKVSDVAIKVTSGEGSIKGLMIGNPMGFSTPDAFTLGDISIKIDPASVTKDVIVIDSILVSKPHVTYEINDSGQANINIIKNNIKQLEGKSAPAAAKEEEKGGSKVKLLIRRLIIEGAQIDVHIPVEPEPLGATMPKIEMSNLGSGGAPPGEIAATVLAALVRNVGPAVAKVGVDKYLGKSLDEMKSQLQEELNKKAGKAVEGLSEKAGEAVKKFLGK